HLCERKEDARKAVEMFESLPRSMAFARCSTVAYASCNTRTSIVRFGSSRYVVRLPPEGRLGARQSPPIALNASMSSNSTSGGAGSVRQRRQPAPRYPARQRYRSHPESGRSLRQVRGAAQGDKTHGSLLDLRERRHGRMLDEPAAILLVEGKRR